MTQYSTEFNHAIDYLFKAEGGYVNDSMDRGGETKYGISKRSYPTIDIVNLTKDCAIKIYHRDYWMNNRCDDFPSGVCLLLFDGAVQHGAQTAVRQLQTALRLPVSNTIDTNLIRSAHSNPQLTISRLLNQRARTYCRIIASNPSQQRFLNGWFNRLERARDAAMSFYEE